MCTCSAWQNPEWYALAHFIGIPIKYATPPRATSGPGWLRAVEAEHDEAPAATFRRELPNLLQ